MAGASVLTSYPSLVVKQDRASICEAVSAWDAPSTSQISDPRKAAEEVLFLEEESSRTCRVCCPNYRPFTQSLYQGKDSRGTLIAEYRRNCKVPVLPLKCCCFQTLYVSDGKSKQEIGFVKEEFFVIMPTFAVLNAAGQTIARIHYPTCCTGMLYDFCPQGTKGSCCGIYDCCCLRPPFLFHQVNTSTGRAAEEADGSISTDIPAGVSLDEGTGAFLVSFPSTTILSATDRMLYLGAAWLIGDVFYKKSSSWELDSCTCCSGGCDYSKMCVCSCRFCCR